MAKKERVNKHPDWQLSRSEKNWYYVGDTARLFCTSLVGSYMTMFLMFQGINTASLATAILLVKIIDSVDDVLFGYIIDRDPHQGLEAVSEICRRWQVYALVSAVLLDLSGCDNSVFPDAQRRTGCLQDHLVFCDLSVL